MKQLLALVLVVFAVAGCSSAIGMENSTQEASPGGLRGIASIATESGRLTEIPPTPVNGSTVIMTADSTPVILTPIQGNTIVPVATKASPLQEDWQTFTSAALGFAVSYPADWSVTDHSNGATFTSPQNTTILLTVTKTNDNGNDTRIMNQRCISRTNANDLTADVCVETASSFSYSARFTMKSNDGFIQWLTLSTNTRATTDVFEGMFNSVRSVN